jgi:sugar phosphate isomerase/epimerase
MSVVVRFHPASLTAAKYDEALRRLEEAGALPAAGLDYHVCFGSDGDLRVSEIWDSPEQFAAFGEALLPILADVGITFSAEPEVFPVHNIQKR